MNHCCNGDYVKGRRLYRCLLDSTIITQTDLPETCPNCGREVAAVEHDNARRFVRRQDCIVIDGSTFVISESEE